MKYRPNNRYEKKQIKKIVRNWADDADDFSVYCCILGHLYKTDDVPMDKLIYHCALREATKCMNVGIINDTSSINNLLFSTDNSMTELGLQIVKGLKEKRLKNKENGTTINI